MRIDKKNYLVIYELAVKKGVKYGIAKRIESLMKN
jgi:hypothetical protein